MISIILPIRNEPASVAENFRSLLVPGKTEILIADDGTSPETSRAFEEIGARVVLCAGTRGSRLDSAAREARGEILFILHADSRPPENSFEAITETLGSGAEAGAFSLAYEETSPGLSWIAWWANVRSRALGLPFGDQGLFCWREAFERAGGFGDLPICDDLDLVQRLKRVGRLVVRPEKIVTSARRYRERGALAQVLRNWKVLLGYFAGVDPARLERWYNRK